jgi:hypothetical protein
MTKFVERRCRECDKGTIRLVATPGRTWRYRRMMLDVPADFEIPTCDACGEEWLDPKRADALDELLQGQYRDRLVALFERAIEVLSRHRSQRALERLLGLSQGYLSKILAGKKVPSEPLVTEVVLIAKSPDERLREVEATWGKAPPSWLADKRGDGRASR